MTQIIIPNKNVTGDNLWSEVEANDQAIVDVVNGDLDDSNVAAGADINGAKLLDGSVAAAKLASGAALSNLGANSVTSSKVDLSAYIDGSGQDTSSAPGGSVGIGDLALTVPAGKYLVHLMVPVFCATASAGTVTLLSGFTPMANGRFSTTGDLDIRTISLFGVTTGFSTTAFSALITRSTGLSFPVALSGALIAALRIK